MKLPPLLLLPLLLAACGDFPRPFAGRPGARAIILATPPPARLVVATPRAALLSDAAAAALAQDFANALVTAEVPAFTGAPRKGDWVLQIDATLAGANVQPHVTLLDAKNRVQGDFLPPPVPASAWAAGDAATLIAEAQAAVPQVIDLLRTVDAAAKQNDPNSLFNRPARIFLAGVAGAPGDGNASLLRQMQLKIPATGDQLVPAQREADFVVRGLVKVSALPGGREQQVEIHWLVFDAAGKEAGDVAQGHDIQAGLLDRFWGEVSVVVADEAAGGVHEVITNWTGRRKAGAKS